MRVLEWLFCLSFIPAVVLPFVGFIPPYWRPRLSRLVAPLPTLTGVLHIVVEGWRIQMVPLYVLAAVILLGWLLMGWPRKFMLPSLSSPSTLPRSIYILLNGVAVLWLVLGGILAGWGMPVVKLPQSAGPYPVGIVDRELIDAARGRRLMISVWYPAARQGEPAPMTHNPDEVAAGLGNLAGVPSVLFQHLRYFTLAASENVPVAANGAPFPVLVFSHGMVGLRLQNSSALQELASRGYIVVALDHTDAAAATVFPDGEARFYDLSRFGIAPDIEPTEALMTEHVLPVWVADQRFVYDVLEKWATSDPLLAGKIDPTRIGSFGHSFGGATALEVCRVDVRCKAAVNLDGGLYGGTKTQPATQPLLLMTSTDSNRITEAIQEWTHLINMAKAEAEWVELPGSNHYAFTIMPLLSPMLAPGNFDSKAGLHTVDVCLIEFFNRHVRSGVAQNSTNDCERFTRRRAAHS